MDQENPADRHRPMATARAATLFLAVLAGLAGWTGPAAAQQGDRVRVFLDCQTRGCPAQEFRTEIVFVDWVRERTAADLHVIVTRQDAGGGREYVFDLIGRNEFADEAFTFTVNVPATATTDERLDAMTRSFQAALASYVARRGYAGQLEIAARDLPAGDIPPVDPTSDPWRMWVFTVGARVEAEGEESEQERELRAYLSANRTTPEWKVNIGLDGEYSQREVELSDGVFEFERDEWELDALVVRSLTPHWSTGGELEINRSTRLNREIGGRAALAVEWNHYPYEQANRRQFLVHYQLGYSHVVYEEETIFGKLEEALLDHRLAAVWQTREPWGDGALGVHYSNFLQDWSKYRLSAGGELSIRLFRGLELDIEAEYDVIRDQLYLPAAEMDDEDILVQRRQLATGYAYEIEVGLSYRFGSIFNNVVNNRFPWIIRRF